MLRFLKSLPAPTPKTLYVVGNQSADMDSCCSALVASFFLTSIPGYDHVQPCIDILRGDLKLRGDITWLFTQLEIPIDKILFKDDHWQSDTNSLFLVDHNSPTMGGHVVGIIDHHQPEGQDIDCKPKIIQTAGSCMSLVVDYYRREQPHNEGWADPVVAALAISPIIQDTRNLTSKDKTTPTDVSSYDFVKGNVPFDISAAVKTLKRAKDDISGFSATDLLNKDYKQWQHVGISSLPGLFEDLLTKFPDLAEQMAKFKRDNQLKEFVALGHGSKNKEYRRELAIVGDDLGIAENAQSLNLSLKLESHGVYFYNQGNAAANRKVVAPIVRNLAGEL